MLIKNARAWAPKTSKAYLLTMCGVLLAFFIRYQLQSMLQSSFPVIFFIFNTTIIAYYFGKGPAVFSVLLSMPLAYYFFIPPYGSFDLETTLDIFTIFTYLALFGLIIFLIEKLQRERYRAILIARVAQSRMEIMAKLSNKNRIN